MHIVVGHTVVMGDDVHHNCDLMNDVTNDATNVIKDIAGWADFKKQS